MTWPSRTLTHRASTNNTAQHEPRGRFCHSMISSATASLTFEIRSGETYTVNIREVNPDVPHSHAAGIQREDGVVEPIKPAQAFWDNRGLERPVAVTRNPHIDWADISQHGLGGSAVARVSRPAPDRSPISYPRWSSISASVRVPAYAESVL